MNEDMLIWLRAAIDDPRALAKDPREIPARAEAELDILIYCEDRWRFMEDAIARGHILDSDRVVAHTLDEVAKNLAYGYRHREGWNPKWAPGWTE